MSAKAVPGVFISGGRSSISMVRWLHTATARLAETIMRPWPMNSSVVSSTADFSAMRCSLWASASAMRRRSAACICSRCCVRKRSAFFCASDRSEAVSRWNWRASTMNINMIASTMTSAPSVIGTASRHHSTNAAIARTTAISRPASGARPRLRHGGCVTSDIDGCDGSDMCGGGPASCSVHLGACERRSVLAGELPARFIPALDWMA